jgi:YD repeat-containing protein
LSVTNLNDLQNPNDNVTVTTEYNDPLLRPTRTFVTPSGFAGETLIEYGDSIGNLYIKTKTQIDAANYAEATKYFDGLGRTIKTKSKDAQGDVFAETQYDVMSRVWKVSNPYRNGDVLKWTETTYDDLGRVKKVKTPDDAEVETTFSLSTSGNQIGSVVTVEDQADKKRRSVTDSLGRLVRVDEPDSNGNLGDVGSPTQPTFYEYDLLGNLKTVTQGEQTRTFVYDSLSRLLSATNPEGGTISYEYDSNSNLKRKTDARGIRTNYDYDALNRVVRRWYEVTTTPAPQSYVATPDVDYFYDGKGLSQVPVYSKGKLTKVSSSVSETRYTSFDAVGRITSNEQVTDGVTYQMSYAY